MFLNLDFMAPKQISNMSLNGFRRRVATRDKNLTETWMEKSLVALDPRHQVFGSGCPTLSFCFLKR
jgi:hypothetical protein